MWIILFTVCISVTTVMSLALCLCWKKNNSKNDLMGVDGMVIQKNPDENVNHLPSADTTYIAVEDAGDSHKRNVSNTRRSLPDIPLDQNAVNWEPSGDNSSEHYATVGQYQNGKRQSVPTEVRPSLSQQSSTSQADDAFSPYERVKYDKIKNADHPYAQVQPTSKNRPVENGAIPEERTSLLRADTATDAAVPSPRSRRSSQSNALSVDIPAASAVAGGISASPELPYMTPPLNQSNFSGDSQDSSKGYTSISVREPLANIIAQTNRLNKKRQLDPHYSTVSDDSDDVYTTIPDPNNQIYTSESETYAKIPALPATIEVEINPIPSTSNQVDELYEPPPDAVSPVDNNKQNNVQSHSRQASSSSSIGNIGSPKPEKRQANSPLPPPPTSTTFDFQAQRNVDDLYAKVHKNRRRDDSDGDEQARPTPDAVAEAPNSEEPQDAQHDYETLKRAALDPDYEKIGHDEPGYASINGPESITGSDPGYEVLRRHRPSNASDCGGYSKIRSPPPSVDGYSVVRKRPEVEEPNYESMPSSEHGYAVVAKAESESDPNYESVKDLEESPYEKLQNDTSESSSGKEDKSVVSYERLNETDSDNVDSEKGCVKAKNESNDLLNDDGIVQV